MRFILSLIVVSSIPMILSSSPWDSHTSIADQARYVIGSSDYHDLWNPSPWTTDTSHPDGFCTTYVFDNTNNPACCIDIKETNNIPTTATPGTDYGSCKNSDIHNCPGGDKATCVTAANPNNNGASCPYSITSTLDGTIYPRCQLAYSGCTSHCWGTIQCYTDEAGTIPAPHGCPYGGFEFNNQVYHQGDFCVEAGNSDTVSKWCGSTDCDDGFTLVDGVCQCPEEFHLVDNICCAAFFNIQTGKWQCTNNAGGHGDPQIAGFQGQSFQFHGLPDETFNLISTPTLQVNGHFVYLSSGKCDYNDTECWTHPGTYIDQLGFAFGDHRMKLIAGTHQAGLQVYMDNDKLSYGNYQLRANGSDVTIKLHHNNNVYIKTHEFIFTIKNSDMFFNLETSMLNQHLLHIGASKHTITDSTLCQKDDKMEHNNVPTNMIKHEHNHGAVEAAIQKKYGGIQVPLHGLIGQTWRNILVCGKHWVGTVSDYLASDLFADDYYFNFYHQP